VSLPNVPRQSSPDETRSTELGLKVQLPELALSLDASIYHIDWQDIQLSLREPSANNFVYFGNGGAAVSNGAELTVNFNATESTSLLATFSYSDAKLDEDLPDGNYFGRGGDRLPLSPELSGSLSVRQEFPTTYGTIFLGGVYSYVGKRLGQFIATADREKYDAYWKLDLEMGVTRDDWTSRVYVNNATDERGVLAGGDGYFFPPARVYTTPRVFGINFSRDF
jgi:iron complex outermembrane recepter protein